MDDKPPIFEKRPLSDDPPEMEGVCGMDVRADPSCREWPPLEIAMQPPLEVGRMLSERASQLGVSAGTCGESGPRYTIRGVAETAGSIELYGNSEEFRFRLAPGSSRSKPLLPRN